MNKYIITYNNEKELMDDYQVVEGKTPKDALKNAFGKDFKKLTGEAGKYATKILVKGDFINNNIIYSGRYQMLCFTEV